MTRRTLSLKRDTIGELTPGDLAAVAGAGARCDETCPHVYCVILTNALSCHGTCHCTASCTTC